MRAGSPERSAASSLTWKTGSTAVSGGDEDCVERVEAIVASASSPSCLFRPQLRLWQLRPVHVQPWTRYSIWVRYIVHDIFNIC